MHLVDALAQAVEGLPDAQHLLPGRIAESLNKIDELERKWDFREDMLKGLE